ncbi:predicted protein [Uncinocarpus reesii 1704]|uniref:Nuclear pore complex component n=1 Tax=Uncinocarpus reesii (strain UAMH 1704) TaxID=336963 RepID=C4JLY1_UNCRE|nr:uncharacterized protein UREG_03839 [Uncinocarpus reesii 1704]EEP78993.1 predicted protein [Uncinocarpus reesii 1704]
MSLAHLTESAEAYISEFAYKPWVPMAPDFLPSTPRLSSIQAVDTPSPGKWRHPHLKEIVQRQNAARFGDKNVRKIVWNGIVLMATGILGKTLRQYIIAFGSLLDIAIYPNAVLFIFRLFFLANIATAFYPLFRPKDDISDIPLTPSQRTLLGLEPNNTRPATSGSTYVTPPRYRLSSSSRKASPLSPSSSPLSGRGSPMGSQGFDGSLYSPSPSPLFQRTVAGGNRDMMRRHSFGSSSSLGRSSLRDSTTSLWTPSSPSPNGGKNGNVLANKWLYERTRAISPGGSVFGR